MKKRGKTGALARAKSLFDGVAATEAAEVAGNKRSSGELKRESGERKSPKKACASRVVDSVRSVVTSSGVELSGFDEDILGGDAYKFVAFDAGGKKYIVKPCDIEEAECNPKDVFIREYIGSGEYKALGEKFGFIFPGVEMVTIKLSDGREVKGLAIEFLEEFQTAATELRGMLRKYKTDMRRYSADMTDYGAAMERYLDELGELGEAIELAEKPTEPVKPIEPVKPRYKLGNDFCIQLVFRMMFGDNDLSPGNSDASFKKMIDAGQFGIREFRDEGEFVKVVDACAKHFAQQGDCSAFSVAYRAVLLNAYNVVHQGLNCEEIKASFAKSVEELKGQGVEVEGVDFQVHNAGGKGSVKKFDSWDEFTKDSLASIKHNIENILPQLIENAKGVNRVCEAASATPASTNMASTAQAPLQPSNPNVRNNTGAAEVVAEADNFFTPPSGGAVSRMNVDDVGKRLDLSRL